MEPVAGVFTSREGVERAITELRRAGFAPEDLSVIYPEAQPQMQSLPVSEEKQPGLGAALGGLVGGAIGGVAGFELGALGAAAVTAAIPGVGPVVAIGIAGAALLGAGGAAGGAAVGAAAEHGTGGGELPAEDKLLYRDALRRGRSIVMVMANGKGEAERAREFLAEAGAESVDAAREAWWISLENGERALYEASGGNYEQDRPAYRAGFEAALRPIAREKSFDELAPVLSEEYADMWNSAAFRAGFERGRTYLEKADHALESGVR